MAADDDARDPDRLLTRPFLLAAAAQLLHALAYNLYLHLPGFLTGLGATEVQIGVLFGVTGATAIAARPALGRVMDTRGRRIVILAGGVLNTVVCALYLSVTSLGPWLYAVRIAHGLGEAMLFASLFAFASDIVPPRRRIEGIAVFGVSGMLPLSLGGVAGDVILARAGYDELFLCSVGCSLAALALSLPLHDPPAAADREPPRGVIAALLQRDLLPLWFVGLVFATSLSAHFTFFKTFVLETGIGSVGLFFTCYSVAAIFLRVLFGSLPERVGPKRVLFPALGATAAAFVLLATAGTTAAVAAAGLLAGLGHGFTFPILLGLVVGRARPSERGAALAIFTALFDAGMLLGAPTLGAVIRAAGYPAMFTTAAGIALAGTLLFAAWDRGRAR